MIIRVYPFLITVYLLLLVFLGTGFVYADEQNKQEVKALMPVEATVHSKVCPEYSTFAVNVPEVLADASQRVILKVRTKDCSNNPLGKIPIELTSNRGAIDKIRNISPEGVIIDSGDGLGVGAKTDHNGFVFFESYSNLPGKTVFTLKVDGYLELGNVETRFLPLPFPKNLLVVVEVPKFISPTGGIAILNPSRSDFSEDGLVNLTMEVRVPIWLTFFLAVLISGGFFFFAVLLVAFLKLCKIQKTEEEDLEIDQKILEKVCEKKEGFYQKD